MSGWRESSRSGDGDGRPDSGHRAEEFARIAFEAHYEAAHGEGAREAWNALGDGERELWLQAGFAIAGHVPGRPAASLEDAMPRNVDGLNDLVRDILQSMPDTADEQEWRDRAGALHVGDPDGQPYRALTEDDL